VPVKKIRDLQEMEDSLWRKPGDPELWRAIARVWSFAARTSPGIFHPASTSTGRSRTPSACATSGKRRTSRPSGGNGVDRQPGAKAPGYSNFALPGRGFLLGAARGQGASPHPQEGSRLIQKDRGTIPAEVGRKLGIMPGQRIDGQPRGSRAKRLRRGEEILGNLSVHLGRPLSQKRRGRLPKKTERGAVPRRSAAKPGRAWRGILQWPWWWQHFKPR
jgi:hypothetical protein